MTSSKQVRFFLNSLIGNYDSYFENLADLRKTFWWALYGFSLIFEKFPPSFSNEQISFHKNSLEEHPLTPPRGANRLKTPYTVVVNTTSRDALDSSFMSYDNNVQVSYIYWVHSKQLKVHNGKNKSVKYHRAYSLILISSVRLAKYGKSILKLGLLLFLP